MPLSLADIERYERQVLLPEWGAAGQERVRAAEVRVTGRGAAAALAVRYLAGAGIGRLVVEAFADEARAINPDVAVTVAAPSRGEEPSLDDRPGPGAVDDAVVVRAATAAGEVAIVAGAEDRAAVGAACAVEALKAILGRAHRGRVALPSLEAR